MVKAAPGQILGFLLIDKPKEAGSFYLVRCLRKIMSVKRIGYAGTLDPLASGLMIVAVGEATKLLYDLEQTDKVYEATIRLGATSETYDAEGPVHPYPDPVAPTRVDVEKMIEEHFSGERMQVPPRYSAVKIAGKHAYDLVRKGKDITIPAKKVVFFEVRITSYEYPLLQCTVHCGPGTYIRSFAHDLGQLLGCGGYVLDLRRTRIGSHSVDDAVELGALNTLNYRDFLLSPDVFLDDWGRCGVSLEEYDFLQHGGFVPNRWMLKDGPFLALYEGRTVGLLELCEGGGSIKFAKKFNLG